MFQQTNRIAKCGGLLYREYNGRIFTLHHKGKMEELEQDQQANDVLFASCEKP